jgi:predicted nuclease of predicted toxin-antitoxin system
VKLLFDQNLPERLVTRFAREFPQSAHVKSIGLASASDLQIWQYARANGCVIISKDGDFSQLALLHGPPPKVIWLKVGNASTSDIEGQLKKYLKQIGAFENQPEEALLVVGRL